MYKLTVKLPGRPAGSETVVAGVGKVKVGEAVELSDKQEREFREAHKDLWPKNKQDAELDEVLKDNPLFEVEKTSTKKTESTEKKSEGSAEKKTETKKSEGGEN